MNQYIPIEDLDLLSCLDDERLEQARKEFIRARDAYFAAAEKALIAIGKTAHQDDETSLSEAIEQDNADLARRLARQAL